jgi:hypothetical protein
VLFSNEQVARFINQNFEPAWEMVRPVPLVRIDFGNGNVVTRTLHGNIAGYVCVPDGQVADIVPGIYTPPAYQAALEPVRRLAVDVARLERAERQNRLRDYHQRQATQLRNQPALAIAQNEQLPPADRGKRVMERRLEQTLQQTLARWQALANDTRINERNRRLQIHERLGSVQVVPEQIKKWLYKEVLHSDLDDPYLGLGSVLLGDDIFREENG